MEYHEERFEDFSLMIFEDGELTAILPANRVEDTVYSHQGLTYGSLIFKAHKKLKHISNYLYAILKFLSREGVRLLKLKMIPNIYCGKEHQALDYLLSVLKAQCYRIDVLSVVMPKAKTYSKDRITGYKRGVKHQLEIKETDDFSKFWNDILLPNLWNKHQVKPVHKLEDIELLKSRFPYQIRQFNVYHNNKLVAGTTIFDTPFVAHSQYISGNTDKNTLGSLDFLHIYLLEKVFHNKPYFDFGTSNENEGKSINEGLLYWKEGFGALPHTQGFYQIKTSNYELLNNVFI